MIARGFENINTEIPRRNHFAINFAQTGRKLWLNHLRSGKYGQEAFA